MKRYFQVLFIFSFVFLIIGCRGYRSKKPPIHPNPNFDWQPRFSEQQLSLKSPEGIVPWGDEKSFYHPDNRDDYLRPGTPFYTGKKNGYYVTTPPVKVTKEFILEGKKQFNIHCATCHTKTGNGTKSQISKRGWIVPNLLQDSTVKKLDGELFDIASNGVRSMSGYGAVLSEKERWAVVLYIRTLQRYYQETKELHD